jgi:hypothetical protein
MKIIFDLSLSSAFGVVMPQLVSPYKSFLNTKVSRQTISRFEHRLTMVLIGKQKNRVHGLHYLIENANDKLLIVDDVFDSGEVLML